MLTYRGLQEVQIYILSPTKKGGCFTEYNNIKQSTFASVIYPNGFGIQNRKEMNKKLIFFYVSGPIWLEVFSNSS